MKGDPQILMMELKRAIIREVRGICRETCRKVLREAGKRAELSIKKRRAFRARTVAVEQWSVEMPDQPQRNFPRMRFKMI